MTLTKREKIVLGEVVRQFIISGMPVSSALIAEKCKLGMSPATIRNILAELERKEYIFQPHTSAGRVPRTAAYRMYVDNLMKMSRLSGEEREQICQIVQQATSEFEDVLQEVTRILAQVSHQLGILVSPRIEEGVFQRLELIDLSSDKILLVMTIESGFVKTVILEVDFTISPRKIQLVSQILNERLQGLKVAEIRNRFSGIVQDIWNEESGLVQVFARKADRLFDFREHIRFYVMGTHHILQQPGFSNLEAASAVVELLENREVIVHLLDQETETTPITIKIGEEIKEQKMQQCSIISARYRVGNIQGILGIIGPTRMNYSKIVPLVDFTARTITSVHGKN